jgi:small subunit ribosomal protein S1
MRDVSEEPPLAVDERCKKSAQQKKESLTTAANLPPEGLVHVSELSWVKRIPRPSDVLKVGQEVEARVIKVDKVERRIGLSVKAANYSEEDLRKETAAFEALRPSTDMVGLEEAFKFAAEEWRPGQTK